MAEDDLSNVLGGPEVSDGQREGVPEGVVRIGIWIWIKKNVSA